MTKIAHELAAAIRSIPDYPKPGIIFRDITTLLGDARAFRRAVDELVQPYAGLKVDKIAGMEARGFILGGAVAHQLSAGFVPIRKKGKLPHETVRIAYSLEYGVDEMEIHMDAVKPGEKVILVDDLIATGGTAVGAVQLLRQIGADVVSACFVIDLPELGGRRKLEALGVEVRTLVGIRGALSPPGDRGGPRSTALPALLYLCASASFPAISRKPAESSRLTTRILSGRVTRPVACRRLPGRRSKRRRRSRP